MRLSSYTFACLVLTLVNSLFQPAHAQLGFDLKIDKPEPYDERVLKAEKTSDRKLPGSKRFFQNLTTHYNYFFNANVKLNDVITGAKEAFHDDYTTLLPFYNYSYDVTSQNTQELDSVIYKAQTGIVMHDLRNDWVDNMYLLWGAAWFLEKKFDSASLMFQFINYSFAEKEKDGYYRYIGSRMDGNNALTISTKENTNLASKLVRPPSRNMAFIWQIRSWIEQSKMAEAGSLIATLRNDPMFPSRLKEELAEVESYWFYKQGVWDSSAIRLVNALNGATNITERARWEFLAAQMFERSKKIDEAQTWYAKSIKHTTDPVLEIYARLNLVRINKTGDENYIDKNVAELLKMARRDKYSDYRDVIYYMAAQMEIEQNHFEQAANLLLKASKYNNGNLASRNKSYLQIADLSYDQKKYILASNYYDSVQASDLTEREMETVNTRKDALKKVVFNLFVIARQDSLQSIAGMSEDERTAYLTKQLKQILRQQGVDEKTITGGSALPPSFAIADPVVGNARGEWYFYNANLKTQGAQKFKQVWGNRPNVDNWRRFSQVSQNLTRPPGGSDVDLLNGVAQKPSATEGPSIESLLANVPLTESAIRASNDSIRNALFALGSVYLSEMDDYASAIAAFEALRLRFPKDENMNEVLFQLYYAYKKTGNQAKADEMKQLLSKLYPESRYATILNTGKDPLSTSANNTEATKAYESIYDLFIEGRFNEALAAKQNADSIYRTTFWQPQLLYIEAVYHVKQREDSLAKTSLQTIIAQGPNSPLAAKAQTMIDVLNRRGQIEAELASLQISRPVEDSAVTPPVIRQPEPVKKDSAIKINPPVRDTAVVRQPVKRDTVLTQPKKDAVVQKPPVKPVIDTASKKPIVTAKPANTYSFEPGAAHGVLIVLDKVDAMFMNEVKNAFTRYTKEKYYSKNYELTLIPFDADRQFLQVTGFANLQEALDYVTIVKGIAHLEIIPWLKRDKYSFAVASAANLNMLLQKQDLTQYMKFLDQNLPGKF